MPSIVIVLMGVAGSEKTEVGKALTQTLHGHFLEGDSLHSPDNREKMEKGIPLTDQERLPWLKSIAKYIKGFKEDVPLIITCSALKKSYRDLLRISPLVQFVYLKGDEELIAKRLKKRKRHFFPAKLLHSQFETLEEPTDALTISIDAPISEIVKKICLALRF